MMNNEPKDGVKNSVINWYPRSYEKDQGTDY